MKKKQKVIKLYNTRQGRPAKIDKFQDAVDEKVVDLVRLLKARGRNKNLTSTQSKIYKTALKKLAKLAA